MENTDNPIDETDVEISESNETEVVQAPWKPLTRRQRRVAGVLIEKSKTTPDSYPLSINGVRVGSNQKSNRSPQMELQENEVEDILYELRALEAVIEVHSGGRVPKYKHQLYEWFGVSKVELSVLAELLLRGEQSLGDLRARASRMDKIDGLSGLKPVFASLLAKNLVVELTPPGRGQVVTHNVYEPHELERLKAQFGSYEAPVREDRDEARITQPPATVAPVTAEQEDETSELRKEIAELRADLEKVKAEVAELRDSN